MALPLSKLQGKDTRDSHSRTADFPNRRPISLPLSLFATDKSNAIIETTSCSDANGKSPVPPTATQDRGRRFHRWLRALIIERNFQTDRVSSTEQSQFCSQFKLQLQLHFQLYRSPVAKVTTTFTTTTGAHLPANFRFSLQWLASSEQWLLSMSMSTSLSRSLSLSPWPWPRPLQYACKPIELQGTGGRRARLWWRLASSGGDAIVHIARHSTTTTCCSIGMGVKSWQ